MNFWHLIFWIIWILVLVFGGGFGFTRPDKNYTFLGGLSLSWLMLGLLAWLTIGFPKG